MNDNTRVKTILILAANPASTSRLRLDEEVREIEEGLRRANKREQFKLEQKWAVRQRDFYRAILDYKPQIVHFSGHGAGVDGIVLEDETGQPALVTADVLASQFALFATKGVECVVLNACYSAEQAQAIRQYVNYVIGMNTTVGDKAAVAFAVAFYDAIAAGEEVEFAYKLGCSQMISFVEHETPVFLKKENITVSTVPVIDIIPPNPYQGLAAFGEEDAEFFFGRETFVNGLVEAVQKQPLVGVIGPSGSGKSSVVYAGLIPQLRKEGSWLIESFRPGNQPFYQLASALVRQLEPELGETGQLREAAGLAGDIQQGKVTLEQVVSRITQRNSGKRLLLAADQFEELYTLCQDKAEQERFADLLLKSFATKSFTLVFTLRADFYGYVLSYRPWRDALEQFTPKLLSSMSREELQRAIEQPAQKLEVQLEPQLTQRILDDVGSEPGNLPLLEFALTRLWSKQQNRVLTHQAYEEIGGVKKALANHAEQIYQQLSETEQKAAQRIFVQLVRPGEGTEDTRRIATRAEVGDENWGLISYLAGYQARLVVTGRDDKSQEDTVEVVHEALIREWITLREWMNANREFRVWQERLKVAMREWKSNNHDSGALLRGGPLTVAQEWLHKRSHEMTQLEQDFIRASTEQRDKEQEELKRRQRRSRNVLIGGLVGALSLTGFALGQWRSAQQRRVDLTAATAKLLLSTEPVQGMVNAINAAGLSRSPIISFPNKLFPAVQDSLFSAVQSSYEKNVLKGHSGSVLSVAISTDGKTIVSGGQDGTVRLWNQQGQPIAQPFKGHSNAVRSVAISIDGKTIVSGGDDGTVRLWNQQGQPIAQPFKAHSGAVRSVAISTDGKTIVSGGDDGTVRLWNQQGQPIAQPFKGHSGLVWSVAISTDGKTIVSGGDDGTVRLWNQQGQPIAQPLKGHSGSVNEVAISTDSKTIVSGGDDGTVRLWNQQGQPIAQPFKGHSDPVRSVAISTDGKTIVSGGDDGTVGLWNQQGQPIPQPLKGHSGPVTSVAISTDGKTIVSGGDDGTVRLWNQQGQPIAQPFKGHEETVRSVAISTDGKTIVSGGDDGTVRLWNQQGQPIAQPLKGHSGPVSLVAISTDGKSIVSGGNNTVRVWNQQGQPIPQPLKGHSGSVNEVAISTDGKTIVSGGVDGTVGVWNQQGQPIAQPFKGHSGYIMSVAISTDGKTIVSGGVDGTVGLWNQQGQPITQPFKGHLGSVNSVAISTDGKTIVSGGVDGTVGLWNQQGQPIAQPFKGHSGYVLSVAISTDGKTIVSGGQDGTVRLWNQQGQLIAQPFKGHSDPVRSVAISTDGKTIVSGGDDGTVRLWDINFEHWLKIGCERLRFHPALIGDAKATCQPYLR
ncbi:MAG: WD40 repeat domain-containing protein [Scytonema hyalinum WJT4-NPBG1]|jgi:WD40 repeat protein/energy-coupling factor transporter ATP-binding protein EcfA2|nr:WD40 repeat domain-containing protein [Scytonema hyalinum WJT4-NPBG1]